MANESELLTRARECTRGGETPIVAWLDGYAAGHADATKSAVAILGETPFGPCVIDESAGQARFGGATCCVCQDTEGGCEFCPKVSD